MKATIVWGEDWEALYVDGSLKVEGHSLSTYDVLNAVGVSNDSIEMSREKYYEEGNPLPNILSKVVTEE